MSNKGKPNFVKPAAPAVAADETKAAQVQEETLGNVAGIEQQEQAEQVQQQQQAPVAQTPEKEVKHQPKEHAPTKEKGFTPVYKIENELNSYMEAMDPSKSIDREEGGKWQYSLLQLIKSILNVEDQVKFKQEWNTLLQWFHKHREGMFNENYMFRFPEQWPGSATEFTTFRRIIYTIIQTADAKGRKKALSEINMSLVTEGLSEDQRNKLINFYS